METIQGELYRVNPNTGAITDLGTQTGISGTPTDLASCTFNGSLAVQKNIVGRVAPTDQFTMTITGGGVTSGNTGTTSGSIDRRPDVPWLGRRSHRRHSRDDVQRGGDRGQRQLGELHDDVVVPERVEHRSRAAPGRASTSYSRPPRGSAGASLVCTFTNTPASIAVTKTPSPTTVTAAGQTITYSYAVTNTGPLPLTNVTVADTQTPPAGALTSGPTCVSLSIPVGTCSGSTVATLAARPEGELHRDLHGDPSGHGPRLGRRLGDRHRPRAVGNAGLGHGDGLGDRQPDLVDLHREVGQSRPSSPRPARPSRTPSW